MTTKEDIVIIDEDDRRKKRVYRFCKGCGKKFLVPKSRSNGAFRKKCCSKLCENEYRAKSINYNDPKRVKLLSDANKRMQSHKNMHTAEAREKANKSIAMAKTGVANVKLRGRPYNSIVFSSPNGIHYSTDNVAEFVRQNPHLFNPHDILWTPVRSGSASCKCKAYNGLRDISWKTSKTWRGWRVIEKNGVKV